MYFTSGRFRGSNERQERSLNHARERTIRRESREQKARRRASVRARNRSDGRRRFGNPDDGGTGIFRHRGGSPIRPRNDKFLPGTKALCSVLRLRMTLTVDGETLLRRRRDESRRRRIMENNKSLAIPRRWRGEEDEGVAPGLSEMRRAGLAEPARRGRPRRRARVRGKSGSAPGETIEMRDDERLVSAERTRGTPRRG